MSEQCVVVNRWRRYGKDRLYVTQPDETKVGWWDLTTGQGYPESSADLPALLAAVEQWNTEQVADADDLDTSAAATDVPDPTPPGVLADLPTAVPVPDFPAPADATTALVAAPGNDAVPVARPWIDLTTNRAGTEAREQALAAREAAPVKTFLARALGVHTDERAWRIGADGEEKVATQLAKVAKKDPRWRFLHAIPVGDRGSDIDHVIVGPGGVFTVNAKHHPKGNYSGPRRGGLDRAGIVEMLTVSVILHLPPLAGSRVRVIVGARCSHCGAAVGDACWAGPVDRGSDCAGRGVGGPVGQELAELLETTVVGCVRETVAAVAAS